MANSYAHVKNEEKGVKKMLNLTQKTKTIVLSALLVLTALLPISSLISPLAPPPSIPTVYAGTLTAGNFTVTWSPDYVKNATANVLTFTIQNKDFTAGMTSANVTLCNVTSSESGKWNFTSFVSISAPVAGWSFSYAYTGADSVLNLTLSLSGPNIAIGESITLKVNLTSPYDGDVWTAIVAGAASSGISEIKSESNAIGVDKSSPKVDWTYPSGSSVMSVEATGFEAGYMKIVLNVSDAVFLDNKSDTLLKYSISLNDTRFALRNYAWVGGATNWTLTYANNTAIPDGPLAINATVIDPAGYSNSTTLSFNVSNTAPQLVSIKFSDNATGTEFQSIGNTYYMPKDTTAVNVTVVWTHAAANVGNCTVYVNGTAVTGISNSTSKTIEDGLVSEVPTVLIINNITLTDQASPTSHNWTSPTYTIIRDLVKPGVPTFTVTPIKGGAVITALNATDDVGIYGYKVYVNGTKLDTVTRANLTSTTLEGNYTFEDATWWSFKGTLMILFNSTKYAGKVAKVEISAVDYAINEGSNSTATYITIDPGQPYFYPIELKKGYNLVSLPLIPESESATVVKSWLLSGSGAIRLIYSYDPNTGWVLNPDTITHGEGYWFYMEDYGVLLVRGTTTAAPVPPAVPPSYSLVKGWNFVGYTSVQQRNATEYFASLESGSYYRWIYIYNPTTQRWELVDIITGKDAADADRKLKPGEAFWIYLYKDQILVPPVP